jgi:hypothetical protein
LSAVILGASERAKAGRQHSSRIESWARSTQPFEFGRPAFDPPLASAHRLDRFGELASGELRAVIRGHLPQPPAGTAKLARDPVAELRRPPGPRVAIGGVELGPEEARGDIGGRVLPDRALRPGKATDEEAVKLHLLAGLLGLDVALGRRDRGPKLIGGGVAGDERRALSAGA